MTPAAGAPDRVSPGRRGHAASWTGLWSTALALLCAVVAVAVIVVTEMLGLPLLAPLVAAGVLVVPLLLVRPLVFLVLVTVAEVANLSDVVAANGIPGLESGLLAAAILAVGFAWYRGQLRPSWSPVIAAGLLYLLVQVLSAVAAEDVLTAPGRVSGSASGLVAVAGDAKAFLWLLVAGGLLLVSAQAPLRMAQAIAATLAVLSAITALQEFVVGNDMTFAGLANVPLMADIGGATARHAGPQGDANFWGRVLVLGLPFALSVAQLAATWGRRLLWSGAALLILGGIVLTGSRGALLAAFVVVCVWALLTGGRAAKALVLAPLLAGVAMLVPGVGSRLLTLGSIGTTTGLEVTDPSLDGRVAAQRVALEMFIDNPVLGVGPGNVLGLAPEYLRRLAIDSPPLAPHNQYLEAAAESGLIGLAAWLILLGTTALVAVRARLLARRGGAAVAADAPVPLSNAVLAALAGWGVASIFLHLATLRTLLFVLALGAALDIRARRRAARLGPTFPDGGALPDDEASTAERSRWSARLRALTAVAVVLLLVIAGSVWAVGNRTAQTWSATSGMQLVVKYELGSDSPSYDLDTLSRPGLVRTLAGIATLPRFVDEGIRANGSRPEDVEVEVSGSAQSARILVTAHAEDAEEAARVALAVRTAAMEFINTLSPLYGVLGVAGPPGLSAPEPALDRRLALLPLSLAVVLAAGLAGVVVADAAAARRRPDVVEEEREELADARS